MIATAGTGHAMPSTRGSDCVLQIWGIDAAHIQRARDAFALYPSRNYWHVTDTQVDQAPTTTIRAFEPDAIAQDAAYGWAWAVYPAARSQAAA